MTPDVTLTLAGATEYTLTPSAAVKKASALTMKAAESNSSTVKPSTIRMVTWVLYAPPGCAGGSIGGGGEGGSGGCGGALGDWTSDVDPHCTLAGPGPQARSCLSMLEESGHGISMAKVPSVLVIEIS